MSSLISLCRLNKLILDDTLRTCIKSSFPNRSDSKDDDGEQEKDCTCNGHSSANGVRTNTSDSEDKAETNGLGTEQYTNGNSHTR
ncbi:hypothetical protein DPMN_160977 [Dreissena polymorpha]|uniref:Uncharacterized protein n=1 Tax=Dreissena polymorpha TaxID=45954 RepID=A0A9D4IQN5_DREPO|nr:hypothetical protein DPMN_160977 [Dreissena polymorpha]